MSASFLISSKLFFAFLASMNVLEAARDTVRHEAEGWDKETEQEARNVLRGSGFLFDSRGLNFMAAGALHLDRVSAEVGRVTELCCGAGLRVGSLSVIIQLILIDRRWRHSWVSLGLIYRYSLRHIHLLMIVMLNHHALLACVWIHSHSLNNWLSHHYNLWLRRSHHRLHRGLLSERRNTLLIISHFVIFSKFR